ncbi:MAG: carboxypeptidase-like regulatory domain-containing protein [Bacteroidales bacterium]|nr:carboxypeptidase-like regulatory domain-containing protein [Bacteroidales bacterium]HOI31576.1 carboxypeptidase-like regulatory domain-containing protein [Bacteroidales bacterium]
MKNIKRILFLVLVVFSILELAICQDSLNGNQLEGLLRDSITGKPVQYANVGIRNSLIGTVSDLEGYFSLNIPDSLKNNALTISSMGFKKLNIPVLDLNLGTRNFIEMHPEIYELSETKICGTHLKQKTRGLKSRTKKMVVVINGKNLGSEAGSPIKIRNRETILRSFHFNITQNVPDSAIFRLKVYDLSSDSIGLNLLSENIIFKIENDDLGEYVIDLLPYNITINQDIFVAVELLGLYPIESIGKTWYSDRINVSIGPDLSRGGIFVKKAGFSKWEKIANNYSFGFWFTTLE